MPIDKENLDIYQLIRAHISLIVKELYDVDTFPESIVIELPKSASFGDFSLNIAFVLKGVLDRPSPEIASKITSELKHAYFIKSAEVAGGGFINIVLADSIWHLWLEGLLRFKHISFTDIGHNKTVLLEFVSANPTGPMHIGHARGAIFGDAISKILTVSGYKVIKDYYLNDAGNQIEIVLESVYTRYMQLLGHKLELKEGMYPGEYLVDLAHVVKSKFGSTLDIHSFKQPKIRDFVIDEMMKQIKDDLRCIGVVHDQITSEYHDIQQTEMVSKAIKFLGDKIYKGTLPKPKGIDDNDWEAKEQLLFRASEFGDDVDRVVLKADGSYTYFAGDLGLAYYRSQRKYDKVIMVLGADHVGYVKRTDSLYKCMMPNAEFKAPITQMVNLFRNGEPFRMSKRAGNYVTVTEVYNAVGKDPLRFVMLSRKNDTKIDFDLDKVLEQNKDNPVFYVQYSYARASSVLRIADIELGLHSHPELSHLLVDPLELNLIKKLSLLPRVVEQAATQLEPHRVVLYIIDLANEFHSLWSKGKDHEGLKFLIPGNQDLTRARLSLITAFKFVMKSAMDILGIEAIEKM